MDFAQREARTCVTLDHDFHSHLALTRGDKPSVVLLRVEGLDAARQAELIRSVYDCCEIALKAGAAVSADSKSIRIRHLPLR
jgi:predicted nuclease of predicted toxin-antitoxin system